VIISTSAPRSAKQTTHRRPAFRIGLVALFAAVAAVALAGPASAHDTLLSSDPADGSTVQTAPATVTLTFDQPVQDFEPVVTVTGPDGQSYQSGSPTVDSTVVTNAVGPLTTAGEYVIAYRVVSADGHPVVGEVKFQFAGAPATPAGSPTTSPPSAGAGSVPTSTPAPVPTSAPVSTAAVAPTSSSSGLSGWVWAALALAAVLIIAAVVVVLRRPRQSG
jgi:hypothetical protein